MPSWSGRSDALGHVSGWGLVKAESGSTAGIATPGDFSWTASPADQLTLSLQTLLNPTTIGIDVPGPMDHFDPTQAYSWPAVRWRGNYIGPIDPAYLAAATAFDISGFANPIGGVFGWSFDAAGHVLSLTYTPVPEPGTLVLGGMAAIGWISFWRRRGAGILPK